MRRKFLNLTVKNVVKIR